MASRRSSRGRWRSSALAAAAGGLLLCTASSAAAKATPSLLGNGSSNTTVGLQVFDHTNLSGGSAPTGTISFRLYGPGDTGCASPVFSTSVAVSGTGSDDSPRYTTTSAGTYGWIAAYSGDANNNPVSTPCGTASQSTIASPAWTAGSVTGAFTGGAIHGTAKVTGGFAPLTGSVTFTLTGPADDFCGGTPAFTSTVPVNGAGSYDSGPFRPTAAGTYRFRIRYDGDRNNYGNGPTSCLDPTDTVSVTAAQLQSSPAPPPSSGGGTPPPNQQPPAAGTPGARTPAAGTPSAQTPGGGPAAAQTPGGAGVAPLMSGPTRCVRGPFRIYVRGPNVAWVTFYVHGKRLRTVTHADAKARFTTTVNPRGMRARVAQRLVARVGGGIGVAVLRRSFTVCG